MIANENGSDGKKGCADKGYCERAEKKVKEDMENRKNRKNKDVDLTLMGVPDEVLFTLTADELSNIADDMNLTLNGWTDEKGVYHPGLVDSTNGAASTFSNINDAAVYLAEVAGTALCATGIACPEGAALGLLAYGEGVLVDKLSGVWAKNTYGDLQETSSYLIEASRNAGSDGEVDMQIYSTVDGGVYIQADGLENAVSIGAGQYYYNEEIAPYLEAYAD